MAKICCAGSTPSASPAMCSAPAAAAADQQPGQGLPALRLRPGDRGAGAHPGGGQSGGPLLPADKAAAHGPYSELLNQN